MIVAWLKKTLLGRFYQGTIRAKIIWITMAAVVAVLCFAGLALVASTYFFERSRVRQGTVVLTDIIASNSTAALVFHDEKTLNEILGSLKLRPSILRACIYDSSSRVVASFVRKKESAPCPDRVPSGISEYSGGKLFITTPIRLEGRAVGTLFTETELQEMNHAIGTQALIILALLFLSAVLAFLLSRWLERFVSRPILELARTAQSISEERDYSVRVQNQSSDEIAVLTDALNHLLIQVERQADEREKLLENTRQAVATRDEFLSIASHELRTPLTPLKLQLGFLRGLVEKKRLHEFPPEQLRDLLKFTDRLISHLSRLVDDLLNVTQISSGKLSIHLQIVRLGPLIRGVIQQFQPEIESAESTVELDINEQDDRPGCWDPFRIEQVIINLLSNALKYGNKKPIKITLRSDAEAAEILIEDQGIGVAREDQDKIFHRFERAVSSRHFGGLGLGLYITQEIVRAHHGSITVRSEPGKGCVFTVRLPVALQASESCRAS